MDRVVKGPYLQWPTASSVTVMWETAEPGRGGVEWFATEPVHAGLSGRARTLTTSGRSVVETEARRIHRVALDGLTPGQEYHYRIAGVDELHPCTAAPPPGRPFSFCVTSETGGFGDDDINRRLFAEIERWRPDVLLMVGDAVSRGANYDDWERFFFAPARRLLASTPFYLCPGNHEEDADWFYRFTAYPDPGNYYGFDLGEAHFTALDSTRLVDYREGVPQPTAELEPGSAQRRFLRQDLAATAAHWRIVFFHYPPYVSGDYEVPQMRELVGDLEAGGVDVVFNSHTIVYERSHPLRGGVPQEAGGIVYVVAGGAGAKPDWFRPKKAAHTACALAVPHFVHVSIAGPLLEAKAIDVDGRVFDTWARRKPPAE